MDMCNEHPKSPRKLWSLLNSLTGRVKSHPLPRATLKSLSETFAAIVSDPSRPVHLVQTAETETRCTSEPSQERRRLCQFSPVSVQMVQNLLQNIDSRKTTGADGIPWPFAKEMCLSLGTIPYSNFQCLTCCRRTATGVQTGRHCPCTQVRRSGNCQQLSINFFPSHRDSRQASWENCVNAAQSFPGQQQSSSRNPVCLPCQPLNWRCPCIYCESLTAGERLRKCNRLSLCRPEQGIW